MKNEKSITISDIFRMKKSKNSNDYFTRLKISNNRRLFLLQRGLNIAYSSFWVTRMTETQISKIEPPRSLSHHLVMISKEKIKERRMRFNVWTPIEMDSHLAFERSATEIPTNGNLLCICVATKRQNEYEKTAVDLLKRSIAKIRLVGGFGGAIHENLFLREDLENGSVSSWPIEKKIWHHYLSGPFVDSLWNDAIQIFPVQNFKISREAGYFFELALQQKEAELIFIFLFIALETEVGKGPRLKQFFSSLRCSEVVVRKVAELSSKRGDVVHSGRRCIEIPDCIFCFMLFRIAVCVDDSDRAFLMRMFEDLVLKDDVI